MHNILGFKDGFTGSAQFLGLIISYRILRVGGAGQLQISLKSASLKFKAIRWFSFECYAIGLAIIIVNDNI